MGNPLIEMISGFKPPEEDYVNEETIADLVQICPAVKTIMEGGDAQDEKNRGFLSTMGIIFDIIGGSGLEESLSGITWPSVERVDGLMRGGKFNLTRSGKPIVPSLVDLMQGKPTLFKGGILLALACVVKRAEEDYGPAETTHAYGVPDNAELSADEAPAPKPAPKKLATTAPRKAGTESMTKVLDDLHNLGIPLENVSLQPEKTNAGIKLNVAIQLGAGATFEQVAKINAIVMAVLNKPVELKSSAGIWVQMSL